MTRPFSAERKIDLMFFKRFTALALSLLLAAAAIPAAAALSADDDPIRIFAADDTVIGDCDFDGKLDILDVTALQLFLAKEEAPLSEEQLRITDADGDGVISIQDATELQRYLCEMACAENIGKPYAEVFLIVEPTSEPTTEPTTEPATDPTSEPTTEPATEPTYMSLNTDSLKLGETESYQLTVNTDAEISSFSFTSDSPEIAEVSENGFITALQKGTATITCSCGELSDSCVVTVCPMASSLTLNKTELMLGIGETYDLNSYVNSGAAAYYRAYSSDNEKVAFAAKDGGLVTALKAGTANIRCTLKNGVSAVCRVTVLPMAATLTLNKTELTLAVNDSFDFNSYVPNGTAACIRTYYSEDPSIVSITASGGIATGQKEGTARIYCVINGGTRAYATVTVMDSLRSIMINHLQEQLGNKSSTYITYINAHSKLNVPSYFAWCAVFAWCTLDQFADETGKTNPIAAKMHVSELAVQAKKLGALHNRLDNDYAPKPGDLFTTSALKRPGSDGRLHIGYVESVETDSKGKVTKVHTIEGNYNWETKAPLQTRVTRGEWVPGVKDSYGYGATLCEYIDLEQLFK